MGYMKYILIIIMITLVGCAEPSNLKYTRPETPDSLMVSTKIDGVRVSSDYKCD